MSHPAQFSPPDPLAVRRIVELPIVMLGVLLAHPVLLNVSDAVAQAERPRGGWAAVAVCTAALSFAHLRLSTRGKTAGGAFTRSVVWGLLLGPINSGISLASVVALQEGPEPGVVGAFMLGTLFGSVAGGCIGILFGLGYSPLAIAATAYRERPTHAGPEKARVMAGAMVLGAALIHHLFIPGSMELQAVGALFGAAQVAFGAYRLASLELFLRAVRTGKEPRWSLARARDAGDVAGLIPIHARGPSDEILYRATNDDGATPYRSQSQWLPVARIAA